MTDNTYLKAARSTELGGVQSRLYKAAGKNFAAYRHLYFAYFYMEPHEEREAILELAGNVTAQELRDRSTLRLLFMHEILNNQP